MFQIDRNSIRPLDEQLTEHSVAFVKSTKGGTKPCFLCFATQGDHPANYPHPDFAGKSLAKYPVKAATNELDQRIGRFHAALERVGQQENTLLLITSDNRPLAEALPGTGHKSLRRAKGSSYEGGVRVPEILEVDSKRSIGPGKLANPIMLLHQNPPITAPPDDGLGRQSGRDDLGSKPHLWCKRQIAFLDLIRNRTTYER